jgi:hypothetical protein
VELAALPGGEASLVEEGAVAGVVVLDERLTGRRVGVDAGVARGGAGVLEGDVDALGRGPAETDAAAVEGPEGPPGSFWKVTRKPTRTLGPVATDGGGPDSAPGVIMGGAETIGGGATPPGRPRLPGTMGGAAGGCPKETAGGAAA